MGSDPVHHSQHRGHPTLEVFAPCLYTQLTRSHWLVHFRACCSLIGQTLCTDSQNSLWRVCVYIPVIRDGWPTAAEPSTFPSSPPTPTLGPYIAPDGGSICGSRRGDVGGVDEANGESWCEAWKSKRVDVLITYQLAAAKKYCRVKHFIQQVGVRLVRWNAEYVNTKWLTVNGYLLKSDDQLWLSEGTMVSVALWEVWKHYILQQQLVGWIIKGST